MTRGFYCTLLKFILAVETFFFPAFVFPAAPSLIHFKSINSPMNSEENNAVEKFYSEVSRIIPVEMLKKLPPQVEIEWRSDFEKGRNDFWRSPNCDLDTVTKNQDITYGFFNSVSHNISMNRHFIKELLKGLQNSDPYKCGHKNMYRLAQAVLIHELAHWYDKNNHYISKDSSYLRVSNFDAGLLVTKQRNRFPQRIMDTYEFKDVEESFAVNLEYFLLDPEFNKRKPQMFFFFRNMFKIPFDENAVRTVNTAAYLQDLDFKKVQLDPRRIYQVHYLLASAGKGLASGYGHSMLRLVICAPEREDPISGRIIAETPYGPECLNDSDYHVVISFRANVGNLVLDPIKGVLGGYPSVLYLLSLNQVIDEYTADEYRDLLSVPLNLSNLEKHLFVFKVLELYWSYRGDYKFFSNNCAIETFKLVEDILLDHTKSQETPIKPESVLKAWNSSGLATLKLSDFKNAIKEGQLFMSKKALLREAYQKVFDIDNQQANISPAELDIKVENFLTSNLSDRYNIFRSLKLGPTVPFDNRPTEQSLNSADVFAKQRVNQMLLDQQANILNRQTKKITQIANWITLTRYAQRQYIAKLKVKLMTMVLRAPKNGKNNTALLALIPETASAPLISAGYGIPLESELPNEETRIEKNDETIEKLTQNLQQFIQKNFAASIWEVKGNEVFLENVTTDMLLMSDIEKNNMKVFAKNFVSIFKNEIGLSEFTKTFESADSLFDRLNQKVGLRLFNENSFSNLSYQRLIQF